jgi:ankyrin repeat protein
VDVNAQGGPDGSALQAATRYGHEEIIKLLLEQGANLNT